MPRNVSTQDLAAPATASTFEVFRFVVASEWRLGSTRFAVAACEGGVDFLDGAGRALGRRLGLRLPELRETLVRELGARRGWLRNVRPLSVVVPWRLGGELVALRLTENAARTELGVEFLVPRDGASQPEPAGPPRFSI